MHKRWGWIIILVFMIAACTSTGDTADQPESAQNLLPNLSGYTVTNADSVVDAITAAAGGATVLTGNAPGAATVAKVDQMLQCMQDRGAVASNIYVESRIEEGIIPKTGVVAVINQSRLRDNFLNCVLGGQESFQAQSANVIEPCSANGDFTFAGDDISYIYVGTHPGICQLFNQHFSQYTPRG